MIADCNLSANEDNKILNRKVRKRNQDAEKTTSKCANVIDQSFLTRNNVVFALVSEGLQRMGDFNRRVEEATERLEQETSQFIKYLNEEVVPAVRQHSTKALRVAAQKMQELANYMDQHSASRK